jgi:hypothetical protein
MDRALSAASAIKGASKSDMVRQFIEDGLMEFQDIGSSFAVGQEFFGADTTASPDDSANYKQRIKGKLLDKYQGNR